MGLQDTVPFLTILLFSLAASVHFLYVVGTRDAPMDQFGMQFYAAFMPAFRLGILGDFDFFELEGLDTVYTESNGVWEPQDPEPSPLYFLVHGWFYVTSMCLLLLMTDLLIGILSSNYDRYEDQGRPLFLKERARMIARLSVWFPGCFHRCL